MRKSNGRMRKVAGEMRMAEWSHGRRGVTIVEVLFAILITTVGLFGAIAIFPVASAQARKARQNDAAANAGRSAVHMFDTLGMRRPFDRWYTWNPALATPQFVAATPSSLDLRQSYCIDTRFLVRNIPNISAAGTTRAQFFPYVSPINSPAAMMHRIAFFPGTLDPANVVARDHFDRFNATTAVLGVPSYGRNLLLSDSIFQFEDDLTFLRPGLDDVSNLTLPSGAKMQNDRSLPSFQIFPPVGTTFGPRPAQGHMSWMATLIPKIDFYTNTGSDEFVLSIVVFYDRPTDLFLNTSNQNVLERTVQAVPLGDGSTGGEFLLVVPAPASPTTADHDYAAARLKLRANDWVLLAGLQGTIPRFQWYRITQCDTEVEHSTATAAGGGLPALPDRYQIYATLMGQDWSFPVAQATLMEGVVAVYEKTIRLDYGSTF